MGKHSQYGVILDAGSSGTRVYVYKWKNPAREAQKADDDELKSLPKLKLKEQKKIHPGVSTFADKVDRVGPDHLKELMDVALAEVPEDKVSETPIFLMATAGVRLLESKQQEALLKGVCSWLQGNTRFSLPDCASHIQVISGETEGLYGWLAANYLLGGFDNKDEHEHGNGHHTYGFLDMGGASAQIAFAPNATEAEKHADNLKLVRMRYLDGTPAEYKVFTATWLDFGANRARERYVEALVEAHGKEKELPDPCLPQGLRLNLDGSEAGGEAGDVTLLGTGKFEECLRSTYPLLGKDEPCKDEPCLFNGQHAPLIDFDINRFVGVSEYWHTTHGVFGGKHKAYDLSTYQHNVMDFCQREWTDIESDILGKRKKTPEEKKEDAIKACFKASWVINVLYDGIGIPRIGIEDVEGSDANTTEEQAEEAQEKGFTDSFKPVDDINGMEVTWTLGKMVLYAAGQVPPHGEELPVGYGDNQIKGAPTNFEVAGSSPLVWQPSKGDDDDDDDDWDDFVGAPSKPAGGLLVFIIALIVAVWLLRKPERRQRLTHFFSNRKTGRYSLRGLPFASKFFGGRSSQTYERILEEGDTPEFELEDVESDSDASSSGSNRGRVPSGNATTTSPKSPAKAPSAVERAGLDRNGLVVRTESRERLAAHGRRSRTGSPSSRQKSALMSPLEED